MPIAVAAEKLTVLDDGVAAFLFFAIFVSLASFDAQARHGRSTREGWSSFFKYR